ncbi:LLM class flavin-dependent oxidoreductase [Kitasatospora sp. CM 4170]|uniref:MupA/Atu3671 family FMN-dependent luciferase-like monooxygenase n=1 Tax=Kitasatospora aburaviensis TaxID=67265 RepID=A0ABW1ERF4_9ACTN|nr:MupA/Atu3671 family FMN-dependent luciferase-like monooxygenase [Kitasatospora sp. CM 4170]WNM44667.1 LLM class flavin-dependent oxidoreductase [Kitasatospora sp. CM 4170]
MDLSLFYFADDAGGGTGPDPAGRYRLLLEGARFADTHGFTAVWTPERHFHRFGGNYPNPAVTGAAVAACTERIAIRAGSVVAPLHHVLRIAEDWAVVDGLSGGRAGLSLASGWNEDDFVLRPEGFADRARTVVESIDTLRRLWRGEHLPDADGRGEGPRIYPLPVRGELPMWLTSSGNPETFRAAGRAGVGVLTHLAGQDLAGLAERTAEYRRAYAAAGHTGSGHVVLMVHTRLGTDAEAVTAEVRGPLQDYLVSALTLFGPPDAASWSPARARAAVRPAMERYLRQGSGLFGTVERAEELVEQYRRAGVDEIACLIDFGLPADAVLDGLEHLAELRRRIAAPAPAGEISGNSSGAGENRAGQHP